MPPGPNLPTIVPGTPSTTTVEITPFEMTPALPDVSGLTGDFTPPWLSNFAVDPGNPLVGSSSTGLSGGTLQLLGDTPPLQMPSTSEPLAESSPLLIAAASISLGIVPFVGSNFVRSYIFNEPMMLRPPLDANKAVDLGYKKQGTLRWMKDAANREGYTIRQNGKEQVSVNGIPLDPKAKWAWVKAGDVIDSGGQTFVITSGYEGLPTSLAEMQRMANRPYQLDETFQQLQGPGVSGSFKRVEGSEVDGRFMSLSTDDGATVSFASEGEGRSPGQSNAAVESDIATLNAVDGGKSLVSAFAEARAHVEEPYLKDDGTLRAGAPKLNQVGFELKPQSGNPHKIDATFVKDGEVEAIVVRLGGGNKPVFEAKDGVSTTTLQTGNDIIITGRFAEALSKDAVVQIVKNVRPATAEGIRDALQHEALIRMELLKLKPNGGRITHQDYVDAYRTVVGRPAPATYRGLYETNFELQPNGDVIRVGGGKPVDRFSDKAGGFMVQIAGK